MTENNNISNEQFQQWPSSKYADPIEVAHGIKLQAPLSEVVRNWWSQKWLGIIEAFGLGIRLERAKLYATRGQVVSIEIENGIVKSFVQGSEKEPYRVIVAVKTIPKAIWRSILQDLASKSQFGICLASKTLPPELEIETVFSNNGVLLFPDRQGEMQTKCSCLDWSNPCKHVAAVYLLLAAEFDRDPFLIFKLRGLAMDDLFALLKPLPPEPTQIDRSSPFLENVEIQQNDTASPSYLKETKVEEKSCTTYFDAYKFWKKSISADEILQQWAPPSEFATLPHSLGEFPFWQGKDKFLPSLHSVYENAPVQIAELLAIPDGVPLQIEE